MPTERYSRIRPNGADSGSAPSARAPRCDAPFEGRAEVGGAEGDHVGHQLVPGGPASVTTAQAARMISPPMEWPDQRDPAYLRRPGGDQPVEQGGHRDAVLGDRQAGVDAQVDRGPARSPRAGCRSCRRSPRPRGGSSGLVLAEAVQEDHQVGRSPGERRGEGLRRRARRRGRRRGRPSRSRARALVGAAGRRSAR